MVNGRIVFLHQFVKKTDKTPAKELRIAQNQMKDVTDGSTLKQFKARAFARPGVKQAYEALEDEFAFLDEVLKAKAEAGLTQAEVAERVGTTQSAIAALSRPLRSILRRSRPCRSMRRRSATECRFAL